MNTITLRSPAKINLFLKVFGERPDGYHEIQTLMQLVDLSDEVFIGKSMASDKDLTNDPYEGFFLFIDREMFEVSPYVLQYVFQFNIVSLQREVQPSEIFII